MSEQGRAAVTTARTDTEGEKERRKGRRVRTTSFSMPSAMLLMMLSTTDLWFPCGLSSRKRIMRQCSCSESQWTSTTRSSSCSFEFFILLSERAGARSQRCDRRREGKKKPTDLSHSSSATYITS